ncbi:hypothetical protein DL89DRAFT_156600 [Linderina pennispora]|uniref:Thioesterase domain-containing protein n=1 Tax=Linderina pennispora TaxID=61395 RepID=A0A1Y1VVP4_9FUNG|nr:uncharacterized protein DL89DRAFT_156600 [Linderina pennispora]ORX64834.1 hypothetical protein DL89DRAFT_156600 [Linderina pennispora]
MHSLFSMHVSESQVARGHATTCASCQYCDQQRAPFVSLTPTITFLPLLPMSGLIMREFLDRIAAGRIPSGNYGSAIDLQIATADAKQRRVTYEYTVTASEVSRNYLDEGWLATVTDNATDPLICAVADTRNTFTTSLTVNNLEKIEAGVRLEIECRVIMFQGRMLQATAVFRDAAKPGTVYAMGLHTMVYKDHVGQVPGGVSLARL